MSMTSMKWGGKNGWALATGSLFAISLFSSTTLIPVNANGMMTSPRSRNWFAYEDGVNSDSVAGLPSKEYCYHCLNTNDGVCGRSTGANYDEFLDSQGNPMPWISQITYTAGQDIVVKSTLETHKGGHMTISACALGTLSTQACFDTPGHELTFVSDTLYSMPPDPNYPERGYFAGGQSGTLKDFEFVFKLPEFIYGDEVMLQWKYITANSCSPPGYSDYFDTNDLPDSYWTPALGECQAPYPNDGSLSNEWPEQFFNCAEVTVNSAGPPATTTPTPVAPTEPTIAPTTTLSPTKSPEVTYAPTSEITLPTQPAPTAAPTPDSFISCSDGYGISSWDALVAMEEITYEVSESPYILSVIASGGAAGNGEVVSEGQGYGVLTAGLVLVGMNENDEHYDETKTKFEGYFNGWRQMCRNSVVDSCQSLGYCDGLNSPCLPGWKHSADLSNQIGSGSAIDGDEDAIIGMIIALKAVESDSTRPSWYDEVMDWADRSCTQFLIDNTELSESSSHRLVKLGSCWGGWGSNGNNPSYHAPGHYRMMRDFQESIISRSYVLPSFVNSESWNMLIDTSYKFLETTRCPDTGLVPNWALVEEIDNQTLQKQEGSFSGSGTPQYEFGAEASRTIWRIAFDAVAYPEESEAQSVLFLGPLYDTLVKHFDPSASDNWNYFDEDSLQDCSPIVEGVFGSWQYNGFIFGPVYSVLASEIKAEEFVGLSFDQQTMVDRACDIVSDITESMSYYPRSWQIIAMITLNGDVARAGALFGQQSLTTPPTPAPTVSLATSSPNPIPSIVPSKSFDTTSLPTRSPVVSPSPTASPQTPAPTVSSVTSSPTAILSMVPSKSSNTTSPTLSPVVSLPPTASPTVSAVVTDSCCTWDFYNCGVDEWCNESMVNCQSVCGGTWVKKSSPSMQCITKYGECTGNIDACCGTLTCVGNDYRQCKEESNVEMLS